MEKRCGGTIRELMDRLPQLKGRAAHLKQQMQDKLIEHGYYIRKFGVDMPEVRNWQWTRQEINKN